ncbi:hypothetical protein F5Y01DRAFT_314978 [Xylaria sp. FL0043]|nr:hypothetical protein F5Y01DRAFT_314978 [Xylaria sp. FL0043]
MSLEGGLVKPMILSEQELTTAFLKRISSTVRVPCVGGVKTHRYSGNGQPSTLLPWPHRLNSVVSTPVADFLAAARDASVNMNQVRDLLADAVRAHGVSITRLAGTSAWNAI